MNTPSTLFLSKENYELLHQKAILDYPFETCGFIIGTKGYFKAIFRLEPAVNMSSQLNKFEINPFDYYTLEKELEKSYLTIIGFYHSHPNGTAKPSRFDIADAWPDYSYMIMSLSKVFSSDLRSWQINVNTKECFEEQVIIF